MKKTTFLKSLLIAAALTTGASAWADNVNATLEHTAGAQWGSNTGASTVDAEKEHYNNDASSGWAGCAYAHFSYTIPSGHSITSAILTYSVNQGGSYGRNDIIYYMKKDFVLPYTTFAGQTGKDLRYTDDRQGTAVEAAATGGKGDRLNLTQDVTTAVRSMYEAGQSYIIFQWTGNAGGADLYGKGSDKAPTLVITTTAESTYDVSFAETTGVAATVKINGIDVTNGTNLVNGTYSFTATAIGYQDYTGSFTVAGAAQQVSFTMTAKTVYNYTVNAVDAENGIIKSGLISGTCYANESTSFYLPTCVLVNGTLYFMTAESSYKEETIEENNQVFSYPYTTSTVDNVVYFVEGENITGASESTNNYKHLASNGKMGRGSDLNVTTLPAGAYTVYVKYINTNNGAHSLLVKAGDTDVINVTDVKARPTKNGSVTLTEPTAITLTAPGSGTSGVDYLYIKKTGDVANITATITSAGWATLYTDKALDFSGVEGLTAYTATCSDNTVTLTAVDDVPANTGVVLEGAAATYNIPVITSSETDKGNLCGSTTEATAFDAYSGYTLYMLNIVNGKAQFVPVTSDAIAAGKAFLKISSGNSSLVRSLNVVFGEDATGINAVNAQQATEEYYNLRGQRVAAPQKGLYIVNGKKVVVK